MTTVQRHAPGMASVPRHLLAIALAGLATVASAQPGTRVLTVDRTAVGHLQLDGPGVETWSIEGAAGRVVSVTARSDTFEPTIQFLSPEGEELARDDDGGPNDRGYDPARVVALLPTDGQYLVRVATDRRASGGAYEVQVHAPTVAPLELNTPAAGRYDDARGPDV